MLLSSGFPKKNGIHHFNALLLPAMKPVLTVTLPAWTITLAFIAVLLALVFGVVAIVRAIKLGRADRPN
jgi:hypothetical protein